jgi:hypothetical protein
VCSLDRYASFSSGSLRIWSRARLDQIEIALEQSGDVLGIGFRDMNDAVDVVQILRRTPPVGIADHDPAAARLERFEHERAGAVGMALA